jgi:hypothetical protein
MKPIKICKENLAEIVAALAAVNGRATAHAYTSFEDVEGEAEYAEKTIARLVGNKKVMVGAKLLTTSGDSVANAYKNKRQGTALALAYKTTGWHLISASTVTLYKEGGRRQVMLTKEQSDKAKADFAKQWAVQWTVAGPLVAPELATE